MPPVECRCSVVLVFWAAEADRLGVALSVVVFCCVGTGYVQMPASGSQTVG